MAQWDRLRQLPAAYTQQLHELYDRDALPMDVRHYLSAWIEKQEWQRAARDHDLARVLFQVLLENLDIQHSRFVQEEAFLLQHNIRRYKQNFQRYLDEPCVLANTILWFLGKEKEILDNADLPKQVQCLHVEHEAMETSSQQDLERKLAGLRNEVQCMEHTLICLEEQQDEFDFKYQTHKMEAAVDEAQRKEQQKVFQLLINRLDECRKSTLTDLNKILDRIDELIDILVKKELVEWQRRQQKACIGAPDNVCLDQLEKWFTCVAVSLFQVREFLGKLEELAGKVTYANDPVKAQRPAMQRRADTLLKDLLRSSLVVETQPSMPQGKGPLVLRTNVQFSVKTRLLVKFPELNHSMKVNVSMDREAPQIKGYRRFNVLGTNSKALNMAESQSGGMVADFRHLTLKEQKSGGGGKGVSDISLSVTEELHIICFDTVFELKGVSVELQASSIPVIIISNSSQQQSAWASVLWFNLLSSDTKDVAFLANSPASTWPQFGEMLSWQFLSATKRGLNEAQLEMIAHRLFGRQKNYDTCKVAWSKFSKENAPDTFWVWFDGILVMVKTYLEDLWRDGLIMGFVSKAKEKSLLTKKQRGTFLLRFSDSIIGGITFSWVEITLNGKPDVKTVTPFTKVDLCQIPFHEIIRNFQILEAENIPENPLIYLYPNTPKEDAFGKYYNEKSGNDSPYIKYIKTKLMFVSKENKLEAMSSMSSDMAQGEGLEPMNGLYGEAAEQDGSPPPLQSPLETHHLDPMQSGTHHSDPMQSGTHHSDPMQSGAHHPDPMQSGAHHPDPMQSGTHHSDPMQSGTHHPDPMQSGTHHPDPMQSGAHHPDPMQSGTHHPDPMQSGTHHLDPMQSGAHHPDPMLSGTHHPDPMLSGTHHPDPMQSGTHHPDPMQSGTHHPDPMISGFGLNTEDDLVMFLNNPNTFTDSGNLQDEPELPDFSYQGFNCLPPQSCGSIFQ